MDKKDLIKRMKDLVKRNKMKYLKNNDEVSLLLTAFTLKNLYETGKLTKAEILEIIKS